MKKYEEFYKRVICIGVVAVLSTMLLVGGNGKKVQKILLEQIRL